MKLRKLSSNLMPWRLLLESIEGECFSFKYSTFVGNIPKSKSKEEIAKEFYASPDHDDDDRRHNPGFCFLEYESHKAASLA